MSIFSPIDYQDPAAAERLKAGGGLLGRFSQHYHRLHRQHIVEGPVLVEEPQDASAAEVVGALEGPSLKVNGQGEVDPRHRRIREAEAAVAAAWETMPKPADPASIEDLMDLAV